MSAPRSPVETRYGSLTVVSEVEGDKRRKLRVRCDCGSPPTVVRLDCLKSGATRSCGCLIKTAATSHGMHGTPTYKSWAGLKERCKSGDERYGGRGIAYDPSWENFEQFFTDMGVCPEGMTLDRRENSLGYSKSNCRWATDVEQANNKRNNQVFEHNERALTVAQWSLETGIPYGTLYWRLVMAEWAVDKALTESIR